VTRRARGAKACFRASSSRTVALPLARAKGDNGASRARRELGRDP
jgi:hypothetical protein